MSHQITPSGGAVPAEVALEYSSGTKAFYPSFTTQAVSTGLQTAVDTLNGLQGDVVIEADPASTGATVSVSTSGKNILIKAAVGPPIVPTGTSNPGSPVLGQLFYRTDTKNLQLWDGSTWRFVTLT